MKLKKRVIISIALTMFIHFVLSSIIFYFYKNDINEIKTSNNIYAFYVEGNNSIQYGKECSTKDINNEQVKICIANDDKKIIVKNFYKTSKKDKQLYIKDTEKKYIYILITVSIALVFLCLYIELFWL